LNKINYLSHNWLVQKINNESFKKSLCYIKGRVIDLGCGDGQYREDILKVAEEYIGVDWKNSFHDQSRVDVFADLNKPLPLNDCSSETVVAFQVLEHLPEPSAFISECFRILKPNGTLILTIPFMWYLHESPYDYFRFTKFGLEYLLKKNSFNVISINECTGFWQMGILKINYYTKRFAKGFLKYLFVPFWWIGQFIAPILDFDKYPVETAGYVVVATKPKEVM
jgi:SAM-dependent methyltransferase